MTACSHKRSHITDSRFYGHAYSTVDSRQIFCDECRFQRWLDVEAELAASQAELGIIPAAAAAEIAAAAHVDRLDLVEVEASIRRTGHSLVGLLRELQRTSSAGAGEYIHYGATTQDIQDTAQALEMRDVLDVLERTARTVVATLTTLAETHAATPALGRTHAQPALPLTFGLKVASWIDELLRHADRIVELRSRVLVAQLFGGVGTQAGFGGRGPELLAVFARRLGLGIPAMGWHTSRDRVAEFVTCLAMAAGTLGRIADEVRLLTRPEFGEIGLEWQHGRVGSSTMPHKRNPEMCEQVVVLAKLASAQVPIAIAAMGGDHERDGRTLRLEWGCVTDVSHYCLAAASLVRDLVSRMHIRTDRILENLRLVSDEICTERLMLALAPFMGKQTAYRWIYDRSQAAQSNGQSLLKEVRECSDVSMYLGGDTALAAIFDPTTYLGESVALVNQVTVRARNWLASSDNVLEASA